MWFCHSWEIKADRNPNQSWIIFIYTIYIFKFIQFHLLTVALTVRFRDEHPRWLFFKKHTFKITLYKFIQLVPPCKIATFSREIGLEEPLSTFRISYCVFKINITSIYIYRLPQSFSIIMGLIEEPLT